MNTHDPFHVLLGFLAGCLCTIIATGTMAWYLLAPFIKQAKKDHFRKYEDRNHQRQ